MAVTWDPNQKHALISLSNGNLTATGTEGAFNYGVLATQAISGKRYWEIVLGTGGSTAPNNVAPGVATTDHSLNIQIGQSLTSWGILVDGRKYHNASPSAYLSSFADGSVVGIAVDADSGKIWWSQNGVWGASGDPGAGINPAFSNLSGTLYPAVSLYQDKSATARFLISAQTYAVPSGFSPFPALYPAIGQGFDTARVLDSGLRAGSPGRGALTAATWPASAAAVTLVHPAATLAETAAIEAFFAANAYALFDVVLEDTGETLQARFLAPPDIQPIPGQPGRRRAVVRLVA